jgi:plastocyanin
LGGRCGKAGQIIERTIRKEMVMSLRRAISGRGQRSLTVAVVLSLLGACWFAGTASAANWAVTVNPTTFGGATNEFTPQVLTVALGDTVTWTRSVSGNPQGASIDFGSPATCQLDGTFDQPLIGVPITRQFTTPGTYFYFDPSTCLGGAQLAPYSGEVIVTTPTTGPTGTGSTKTAGLTATVSVSSQFKSVTVSTASTTFGNCNGGSSSGNTLGFPNGSCTTAPFNVTNNGSVPESIDVQASNAIPSDNGTPWSLIGPNNEPGQDQYQLRNQDINLSTTPGVDPVPGTLQPNVSAGEILSLTGPTASSDPSGQFASSVLYTAF